MYFEKLVLPKGKNTSNSQLHQVHLKKIFAYGDNNFDDDGFGCLYRCVQTLRSFYGKPNVTVKSLMRRLDKEPDYDAPLISMWAEPSDVPILIALDPKFPQVCHLVIFSKNLDDAKQILKRPPQRAIITDYDELIVDPESLWTFMDTSIVAGHPLIVDDKTCSYVVYGTYHDKTTNQKYLCIVDPHRPDLRQRMYSWSAFIKRQWLLTTRDLPCSCDLDGTDHYDMEITETKTTAKKINAKTKIK